MVEEVAGWLSGADAGDVSVVLLEVVCNLDWVELVCDPEECEEHKECGVEDRVSEGAVLEVDCQPLRDCVGGQVSQDDLEEGEDCAGEDDWHDIRVVHAERQVGRLDACGAAESADGALLRVADGDFAHALGQDDCADGDRDEEDDEDCQADDCQLALACRAADEDHLVEADQCAWDSGDDVDCNDKGRAVADATLRDHFTEPGDEHGAAHQDDDGLDHESGARIEDHWKLAESKTAGLHHCHGEHDSLDDCDDDGHHPHDEVILLHAAFAFAGHLAESRDDRRHQLQDDGGGDVRHDAQRTDGELFHCAAAEEAEHAHDAGGARVAVQVVEELLEAHGVDSWARDGCGQLHQGNHCEGEEETLLQFRNLKAVQIGGEHISS